MAGVFVEDEHRRLEMEDWHTYATELIEDSVSNI